MKITKETTELVFDLEYIIGNSCYNPNSYDGYTGDEGREFRYPVYAYRSMEDEEPKRFRERIVGIPGEQIETIKYKFGSNHLFIGTAILDVLATLEERYGINFNDLEEKRKKE